MRDGGTAGCGSRNSHLVLAEDGIEIHPDIKDPSTGKPLKFKPENQVLKNIIQQIELDTSAHDVFKTQNVPARKAPEDGKTFEPAWADFREGKINQ